MEELFLDVELRPEVGKSKVNALRNKGFVPAVIYAAEKGSQPVKLSHKQLFQMLHQHRLENVVINLRLKSADAKQKDRPCLIKEIQYDPVKGDIVHVDFNEISLTKVIKVGVPVVAKGEPIGVKQEGGALEHILWEIEVECLPTEIPENIQVDVSNLKIGDSIHVKDINFPANVKVVTSSDAIVLSVAAPIKEEVAAPVEGEEKLEPEVIKEKKEAPAPEGEEKEEKQEKKEK